MNWTQIDEDPVCWSAKPENGINFYVVEADDGFVACVSTGVAYKFAREIAKNHERYPTLEYGQAACEAMYKEIKLDTKSR